MDLRWLNPLSNDAIIDAAKPCECRKTGSVSEELMALLVERGIKVPFARVCAEDSFIPLAAAANLVLPSVEGIHRAALDLTGNGIEELSE